MRVHTYREHFAEMPRETCLETVQIDYPHNIFLYDNTIDVIVQYLVTTLRAVDDLQDLSARLTLSGDSRAGLLATEIGSCRRPQDSDTEVLRGVDSSDKIENSLRQLFRGLHGDVVSDSLE